ncbi:MAG TPA: MFS transporter [Acetobacteraceae bacterium]|nr:MFS transporter [Acetobacteraceae bacterium]
MVRTVEQTTLRKAYLRLLPFAIVTYFFCYVDRINVGFAALTMNKAIGLTPASYGMAAGAFFWGYVLFEVPSNIIMEKVGARLWIARIMISWGLLSAATAFAGGAVSFGILRFLLGVAEAGFYPGIVLYFSYWFPEHHRARIVAGFTVALPLAIALGAPVSTAILKLDGFGGLAGWQWLFILEAVPTVLLGLGVLLYLTDKPEQARWLTPQERDWLAAELASERRQKEAVRTFSLLQGLFTPKVLLISLQYFGIVTASLGMALFIPQIIKELGLSNMQVGFATMIPYLLAAISMVTWGYVSDRMHERRWNLFWACVVSTIGLIVAGWTTGTYWSLVGMSVAAIGFYGSKGPFWAMPSMFLSGSALAAAVAWINSLGNLGGYFGPSIVGWARDLTGSYSGGLYALAGFAAMSAIVAAFGLRIPPIIQRRPSQVGAVGD